MARRKKRKKGTRTRAILTGLALLVLWIAVMTATAWYLIPRSQQAKTTPEPPPPNQRVQPGSPDEAARAISKAMLERTLERLKEKPADQAGAVTGTSERQAPDGAAWPVITYRVSDDDNIIVVQKTVEDLWSGVAGLKTSVEYPDHGGEGERVVMTLSRKDKPVLQALITVKSKATHAAPRPPPRKIPPQGAGTVVIIIDDVGNVPGAVDALLELNLPLTFAVLPNVPYAERSAQKIAAAGREVILHMPMQPVNYPSDDPGRGALLLGMTPDAINQNLADALTVVPGAKGVNNHMGSAFTTDADSMRPVLELLKERGLFFVDSRTNVTSIAFPLAREMGVPAAQRRVFLDHTLAESDIEAKVWELCAAADQEGFAVGIGHPHPETISVLARLLPQLAAAGRRFAHVSEVVK